MIPKTHKLFVLIILIVLSLSIDARKDVLLHGLCLSSQKPELKGVLPLFLFLEYLEHLTIILF